MQWTDGSAYGEDPYGGAGYTYAYGYEDGATITTAWDSPHADALTAPLPRFGTPGQPEPDAPAGASVRPVFVDSSGRRQRRVIRAARLLVIPAGAYVALLVSTLLGGPTISAPFVPQPRSAHSTAPRATAPDSSHGTGRPAKGASPAAADHTALPTAQQTAGATDRSAALTTPAATSAPTATPTRAGTRASATTPATARGRAVGTSHKPVK